MPNDDIHKTEDKITKEVTSERVTTASDSVEHLINLIRMKRTMQLRKQKTDELNKLTQGQSEVSFANNLRRILTLGVQADGGFEMNDELERMLSKALDSEDDSLLDLLHGISMRFEVNFDQDNFDTLLSSLESDGSDVDDNGDPIVDPSNAALKSKLDEIGVSKGNKPTTDQMKKLNDLVNDMDNSDARHLFKDNSLLQSKRTYSKAERENIVESIRLFVDQKHSLNDMAIQTLIRLESEMDQTYQYLMSINKTFSDTLRTVARNIKGT